MVSNASNSDVISLTSSDEEENISGNPTKKFRINSLNIAPIISLTPVPVRNSRNNVILLDSDDEGPEVNKNSNGKGTSNDKEDNQTNKNKVRNPINALLKKNGITVRQKGEVVSLVIDSDSDNTDIEKNVENQKNLDVVSGKTNTDEDNKNGKRNNTNRKRKRSNGTHKDGTKEVDGSIIIDDSDDDTEKENHCENDIEPFPVNIDKTSSSDISSAITQDESRIIFKKFLKLVEEKIVDSSFEEILPKKIPIIEKYFKKSGLYVNGEEFKPILTELIEKIQTSQISKAAKVAVLAFHKVFEHLKSHVAESAVIIEKDNYPKVKKLERTIKLLQKKIKQLDEAEIDLNDENDNDSSYIMVDKYLARLNKVYAKYCQYIGRNPRSGASIKKICYVNSKYNAINRALSKKYQNHTNFPSYYELKKLIEKVAKKENLNLSEQELRRESEDSFKCLGDIMQKNRKNELFALHLNIIEYTEDPAAKDISLENVLKKNYAVGKEKIDKIFELYVNKQNQGEDYESTHEGDTSAESDVENKKEGIGEEINEETSVEQNNENEENKCEIVKMDKGKSLMNGSKTVKKKSRQISEESTEVPNNAIDASDEVEKKTNENIEEKKVNDVPDDLADTSLKNKEDAMETD